MAKVLLSLGLAVFSMNALAGTSDILASNNQFVVQFMSTSVDYSESGNGFLGTSTGLLDTETGSVTGIGFSASGMNGPGNLYWQAGLDYSRGQTGYTGSLQGGVFGSYVGVSSATLINYDARIGEGIPVQDDFMLTPFLEMGGHEWDRGVNYGEVYTHYYFGPGLMGQYSPRSQLVLSITALLGRTIGSHIKVNSGPLMNGFSGALGNSTLTRLGAAADYAFNPKLHGTISVEYTSFQYGMSAVFPVGGNLVAWEPDSQTRYIMLKIGLGAAF